VPRQSHAVRSLVALACAFGALVVPARALAAEDLVVLDGDPAPLLQGNLHFARVYINSTLRLTGNTALTVDSLYIGPRAQIQSCWVPDPLNPAENGDPAGCVNGPRSSSTRAARCRSRPRSRSKGAREPPALAAR